MKVLASLGVLKLKGGIKSNMILIRKDAPIERGLSDMNRNAHGNSLVAPDV
jgi:hypothetical protein